MLLCVVLSCDRTDADPPTDRSHVQAWSKRCASRLIQDASDWFANLDPDQRQDAMEESIALFLGQAGWLKTYAMVMDSSGAPFDLQLNARYWDAAAAHVPPEELQPWQDYASTVLDQVRVATGLVGPPAWSDEAARPVVRTLAQEGDLQVAIRFLQQEIPLPASGPITRPLRRVLPTFPMPSFFAQPPDLRYRDS